MSTFVVVKSKSELCNRATYIREFKLTFFAFKKIYHIVRITIQRAFKNVKCHMYVYIYIYTYIYIYYKIGKVIWRCKQKEFKQQILNKKKLKRPLVQKYVT